LRWTERDAHALVGCAAMSAERIVEGRTTGVFQSNTYILAARAG
jgi:hypothetical protein